MGNAQHHPSTFSTAGAHPHTLPELRAAAGEALIRAREAIAFCVEERDSYQRRANLAEAAEVLAESLTRVIKRRQSNFH